MKGLIFSCNFEKLQGRKCVKCCLAAKEVVRTICNADFQNCGLNMYDEGVDALFAYEYVKVSESGLFLMEIENLADGYHLLVLIDTRTDPDFITISKTNDATNHEIYQVARVLENALEQVAAEYGWKPCLTQNELKEVVFPNEFMSAMSFINDYEAESGINNNKAFKTYEDYILVDDKRGVLKLAHELTDGQTSAQFVIGVQYDMKAAGVLSKEHPVPLKLFQDEFGNGTGRKRSSYSEYLGAKSYIYKNDEIHENIISQFKAYK